MFIGRGVGQSRSTSQVLGGRRSNRSSLQHLSQLGLLRLGRLDLLELLVGVHDLRRHAVHIGQDPSSLIEVEALEHARASHLRQRRELLKGAQDRHTLLGATGALQRAGVLHIEQATGLQELVGHGRQSTGRRQNIELALHHRVQELGLDARRGGSQERALLLRTQHGLGRRHVGRVHKNLEQGVPKRVVDERALLIHELQANVGPATRRQRLDHLPAVVVHAAVVDRRRRHADGVQDAVTMRKQRRQHRELRRLDGRAVHLV